jgi:hypothetical protein
MPFSRTTLTHTADYWDKHFLGFLKPLIEENPQLQARRSTPQRGDLLRRIITDLVTSPIVVADLTDNNPNVFWELGVRQSFKHGTITILEEGNALPFDVATKGTLTYYPKDHLKLEDFRIDFKRALQDCLSSPNEPDSHVLETMSGRGSLYEIFRKEEILRRLDALLYMLRMSPELIRSIEFAAKGNETHPRKPYFPTARFQLAPLELLQTNRYLDADDSLYTMIDLLLLELSTCNEELNLWQTHQESVNEWMLHSFLVAGESSKLTTNDLILKLGQALVAERQKLASQF